MAQDPTPSSLTAEQVKHLEFIQGVIGRISNGSFIIKGWALTVLAAFFGFFVKDLTWQPPAAAVVPVVGFWLLDTYFLRLERLFRKLYDDAREPGNSVSLFSMDTSRYARDVSFSGCATAPVLVNFYGSLALADLLLFVVGLLS